MNRMCGNAMTITWIAVVRLIATTAALLRSVSYWSGRALASKTLFEFLAFRRWLILVSIFTLRVPWFGVHVVGELDFEQTQSEVWILGHKHKHSRELAHPRNVRLS